MRYLINKFALTFFTNAGRRHLLSLTLLCMLPIPGQATGVQDFGPPTYVNTPAYCKKVVRFNTKSGFDGFASLHWEEGGRGKVPLPDGTADVYGHKALIGIFQPDFAVLAGKPKGTMAFKDPYFIKFGEVTSGPEENDLVSGDMNGDGFDDLVLLNSASKWVAIYYNDGDGKFPTTPTPLTNLTTKQISYEWNSTVPSWAPDVRDYPFQLAVGDFNGDGKNDFAVSFVHSGGFWYTEYHDFVVLAFLNTGSGYKPQYVWGNHNGSYSYGCLPYHDSPYWTIGAYDDVQPRGSIFQMVTARDAGATYDTLFFRLTSTGLYKWDMMHPLPKVSIGIAGLLPPPIDWMALFGPFTVTNLDTGSGFDIISGAGKNVIFDSSGAISIKQDPSLPPYGAVAAADFDADGNTDIVRLHGDLPAGHTAGTELRVVFGDGSTNNPFYSGGLKLITYLKVTPRWWEAHGVIATGNFTGDFDLMTNKPFQSIMVLGTNVVVIYPNVGNDREQLNKPSLDQILTGPEAMDTDIIRITGQFWLGTTSEITELTLTADPAIGGKGTTIPRSSLMIDPVTPTILEFALPVGLTPGDYTVTVKNARWASNELKLKIIAPRLDAVLTGPEAKLGDTVLISGDFLLGTPSEITDLILTEDTSGMVTIIPRASLTITAGPPQTLEFTVPGGLALGNYTVTVKNMKSTSNGLKLKLIS